MKIEKELQDDHQIKLSVELEAEPLEKAKHQAARKIAKKVKIPGFRPGKAPYGVILRTVGEGAIVDEAIELMVNDIYPKVLEEADIKVYGPGSLENVESLEPPTLIFTVPLEPEVELGDYKALEIPYEPPVVDDEKIDGEIEQLREQHSIRETVERPAEVGDLVFMRLTAVKTGVEESEDQDNILYEGRFTSSVIHDPKNQPEREFPYVGFSQELIGVSAEEEKIFKYTYPADHENEELQGATVEFQIVVTNIQSNSLPKLDDEFAKIASDFDTLDELKDDIRKNLEAQSAAEYEEEYDTAVLDKLIEECTLKYPPQMVEREKEELVSNMEYQLSRQGITKELYLQIRQQTEEEFNEEIAPVAEERVKRGLVLMEVAKDAKLKIDPDKLTETATRTLSVVTQGMTPKNVKDLQKSGYSSALVANISADLLSQKAIEYLRAIAKGEPLPEESDEQEAEVGEETPEAESRPEETEAAEPESEAPVEETEIPEPEADPQDEAKSTKEEPVEEPEDAPEAESDSEVN